jgi:release factor glutamine methyltransferase
MSRDQMDRLLVETASQLRAAGIPSPRQEARLLLAHAAGVRQEDIVAGKTFLLTPEASASFERAVRRRVAREPFAYIVGAREFWSLSFAVERGGALIPRPESETLIEEALRRFPDRDAALRVADLGTGSGCLLLAFLSERPRAQGVGGDLSDDALVLARRNAETLGLQSRARFLRSDWAENLSGVFDVVFINPPYISHHELESLDPDVVQYEPRAALDGGPDGLDSYRQIAPVIATHLSRNGLVFFELGQGQEGPVEAILAQQGVTVQGTVCDLAGIPRCLVAGLNPAKVAAKKELALSERSG